MGSIHSLDLTSAQRTHSNPSVSILLLSLLLGSALGAGAQTFVNPMFASQDPYVTFWQGNYYYTESAHNQIQIRKSPTLTGIKSQTPHLAWTSPWKGPDGRANVWAPEIHRIEGIWYIYYAADFQSNGRHRLYVLEGGADPLDPYKVANTGSPQGLLVESTGKWAIDPDVFYGADGRLYLTWSCTADDVGTPPQNLCIARMSDALHIGSATSQIASPTETWEKRSGPIEEGPIGFTHSGNTYLTFSASASWTPNDYSVGILINTTGDLLDPKSWTKRGPIFDRHGSAYGPGSVVFVPSPDGTELWNVYHAYDRLDCARWACRTIRMQKVEWDSGGLPLLGYPSNPGVKYRTPSGEMGSLTGWGDSPLGIKATGEWGYTSSSSIDTVPGGDGVWQSFRSNAVPVAYTVSAKVNQDPGSRQYGVYAVYRNAGNHVEAYLDSQLGVFASNSSIAGQNQTRTYPLDRNFDFSVPHELKVSKSASGRFSFYLDGVLQDQRTLNVGLGQVGAFATNSGAHFREVSLNDNSFGWGDAYGDAAEGLARGANVAASHGFAQGNWTISSGSTIESPAVTNGSATSPWNTIYQGNPNFSNYAVQSQVQLLDPGTRTALPSFGIIVCHDDRNNQLSLWIDPARNVLTWNAVVRGHSTWQSVALPLNFDPAQTHLLKANKAGPLFTFSLDGNELAQDSYPLVNGTSGVVTQNARVEFQHFSVVDR